MIPLSVALVAWVVGVVASTAVACHLRAPTLTDSGVSTNGREAVRSIRERGGL